MRRLLLSLALLLPLTAAAMDNNDIDKISDDIHVAAGQPAISAR